MFSSPQPKLRLRHSCDTDSDLVVCLSSLKVRIWLGKDVLMDIAVPEDLPVLSAEEQQLISSKPLYLAPEKKDFEASAKAYFEKRDVVPMLNALLTEIYLVQPDDPIDHMLKFLLRHATMRELREHQDATAQTLHHVADQAVAYSARFKLPHLFDELLTALLAEAPEDVVRFSLTWIRWHKNGFIARHVPEGYRAYLAAKDSAGTS